MQSLPLNQIVKSSCNQRFVLDESNVLRLIHAVRNGDYLPSIIVRREGNYWGCIDGFHRVEAHRRCGLSYIEAIVGNYTDAEAILISHASGTTAQWTDGEKCKTYSQLYNLGVTLDEIKTRFNCDRTNDTVKRYIAIGYYLHPSLLEHCQSGGRSGKISLSAAEILANFNHQGQVQLYTNGYWTTKSLKDYVKMNGGKVLTVAALFNKIPTPTAHTPVSHVPVENHSPQINLAKQITDAVETMVISKQLTRAQVAEMFHEIYVRIFGTT